VLWVALPQIDRAPGCKQPRLSREGDAMSFGLYAIGLAIAVGGLICGAHLVLMPAHWIAVGAIVLLEVVILNEVKATRQKDPVGCDRMAVYTTNTVSRPLVSDALAVSLYWREGSPGVLAVVFVGAGFVGWHGQMGLLKYPIPNAVGGNEEVQLLRVSIGSNSWSCCNAAVAAVRWNTSLSSG
jgi:hypothetical protein